ncbi:type IV toxin-antitoxin system AbiEi family antitoxin [bacterium]|nr:type IV toxin-antitoxin system AbiEi family antitoxin [bacterium]
MSIKTITKINKLISSWPSGLVYTQKHLQKLGYDSQLVHRYIKSGWIEVVGAGAYMKANDNISWRGGLSAIQYQADKVIHVGGKTALFLQGYSHYGVAYESEVFLFAQEKEKLPKWYENHDWSVKVHFNSTSFQRNVDSKSFVELPESQFKIRVSSPERAVLEILYLVPNKQGFDEGYKLIEMLPGLRPTLMQSLLEDSQSIKVNRLFLFMAESIDHPWFASLDAKKIFLGSGKRVIVKNGKLDKKYNITVPHEYIT